MTFTTYAYETLDSGNKELAFLTVPEKHAPPEILKLPTLRFRTVAYEVFTLVPADRQDEVVKGYPPTRQEFADPVTDAPAENIETLDDLLGKEGVDLIGGTLKIGGSEWRVGPGDVHVIPPTALETALNSLRDLLGREEDALTKSEIFRAIDLIIEITKIAPVYVTGVRNTQP